MDVFEKFIFQVKKQEKEVKSYKYCLFMQASQASRSLSRGSFPGELTNQGLHKGPVQDKQGGFFFVFFNCKSCKDIPVEIQNMNIRPGNVNVMSLVSRIK